MLEEFSKKRRLKAICIQIAFFVSKILVIVKF